ncbi:MAG: TldD/PmbA family protein, partial [Alphaproteobacteria bacterium]|nr:TldD/PmbA family protein [Alphaproteobacteria bacterium]
MFRCCGLSSSRKPPHPDGVSTRTDPRERLETLIRAAKQAGADQADALLVESVASSVSYRMGNLEDVERAEAADLGLRVFVGKRVAFVSSTDLSADALAALPGRAVAMAKLAPEDEFACLAPRELLAKDWPALDLEDPSEPPANRLIEQARAVEGAALAVAGVTNSEGGGASFGRSAVILVTSEGFAGQYAGTSHSIGVAVLAGEGTGMERDYDS